MLYDPKWEIQVYAFTLPDFIAWLETKDPAKEYDFDNCDGYCLMGQYMAARGRKYEWKAGARASSYWETCREVFGDPGDVPVLLDHPRTFGAALKRARAASSAAQ